MEASKCLVSTFILTDLKGSCLRPKKLLENVGHRDLQSQRTGSLFGAESQQHVETQKTFRKSVHHKGLCALRLVGKNAAFQRLFEMKRVQTAVSTSLELFGCIAEKMVRVQIARFQKRARKWLSDRLNPKLKDESTRTSLLLGREDTAED